jgi:hypothetical protein
MKVRLPILDLDFSMFSLLFELVARPLAVYFIMNSRIYQSPDLYTVVSNRLVGIFVSVFRGLFDEHFPAHICLCSPIIAGYLAKTPARLYTQNGVYLAHQ